MNLTAKQVAEKLNISVSQINTLVKHGKLKPINGPAPGKTRFNRIFNSADINRYKTENGSIPRRIPKLVTEENKTGFITRLERIESKLDKLLKMWS